MTSRRGEPPDCSLCPERCPELLPENGEIMELWSYVRGQWRLGGDVVAGLDYGAVLAVADALGIDVGPGVLEGIRTLERIEKEKLVERMAR
ncbi:DUF1799 domain-containing protein [Aminithiophilus ramosus]|uniref:DUF1799 domain-containing protein n=1 Tax=Aminithiophilus ramosus TaxID=3029084 RepID=A0A9Q7AFE8_9BACT|nr:DUF1799 domain-containing protein [Aminithiophilus ramosus]QTX33209.1 DUF1799 domain-containing protein [Aminithiophilus ramosus]